MSNEVPICVFYWTFKTNMCKYKLPQLSNGPRPPANRGCSILSASAKIIPPTPPRTEPSPVPCFGVFPSYNSRSISDPNNCSRCWGFNGYPDSWPPRGSDSRYGPSNTTWAATGEEKQGSDFNYLVEWTLTEKCGSSRPRTRKTTIQYKAKWIIQNGISTTTGYTVVDCGRRPPPPPPPPPTS